MSKAPHVVIYRRSTPHTRTAQHPDVTVAVICAEFNGNLLARFQACVCMREIPCSDVSASVNLSRRILNFDTRAMLKAWAWASAGTGPGAGTRAGAGTRSKRKQSFLFVQRFDVNLICI